MKKLLSVLLTLALALLLFCAATFTASAEIEGDFEYELNENGDAVITLYRGTDTDLTIPATLGGKPVTEIGDRAFYDCDTLETVTVPEGVTQIDSYAFASSDHLASITLPDSLRMIGSGAFEYCASLTAIAIPAGLVTLEEYAFEGCDGVTSITVASGNTYYHAAGNCLIETARKTLVVGCQTSVIPDDGSVTEIGWGAFSDCTTLTGIAIPEGVTRIRPYAFLRCGALASVTLPSTLTIIDDDAFGGCTVLASLTLPESLTEIGEWAFEDNETLTEIVVPAGVTEIGVGAFAGCTAAESLTVAAGNPRYKSADNCLIDTETGVLLAGCKNSAIPDDGSIIAIGDGAFERCDTLTSVVIPDGVTRIGRQAFYECSALADITVPDSVYDIGGGAFLFTPWFEAQPDGMIYVGKVALYYKGTCPESFVIDDGTVGIAGEAFSGASDLLDITIPKSVICIGETAFYSCYDLKTVHYGGSKRTRKSIAIDYNNDNLLNATWEYADASGADPGDADGDGHVTMKDVLVIRKHIAGMTVDIDLDAADADGDGGVTMKDVLLVRKFIAGLILSL